MSNGKIIYVDVETTGLDPVRHGVHQLSGAIEIEGELREHFDYRVRPFGDDEISDDALTVSGLTRSELDTYANPVEVFAEFCDLMARHIDRYDKHDKFHFVAYNARFDADFLRQWWLKNGSSFFGAWFWHPPIDVMGLAAMHLIERRSELANFKLATVAQAMGIEVDEKKLHDSMYDIYLTRQLFQRIAAKGTCVAS